ncbi:unnamed protein product [Amoebophrya sp. A25]|nr:unnamed protein product [Amoebophrya sp. A25]|eukprot:GSA25T00018584001.1
MTMFIGREGHRPKNGPRMIAPAFEEISLSSSSGTSDQEQSDSDSSVSGSQEYGEQLSGKRRKCCCKKGTKSCTKTRCFGKRSKLSTATKVLITISVVVFIGGIVAVVIFIFKKRDDENGSGSIHISDSRKRRTKYDITNLVWPLEFEGGRKNRRAGASSSSSGDVYYHAFGIRMDFGVGVSEAENLLVTVDTAGGSLTYFSTPGNAFQASKSLVANNLGSFTMNYVTGHAQGTIVKESHIAVRGNGAIEQLRLNTDPEKAFTLLHVPIGATQCSVGFCALPSGVMGLSFGLFQEIPNTELQNRNPWFDHFAADARNRGLGANYPSVFSFDLTHVDGHWQDSPRMIINALPTNSKDLLRFPIARGLEEPSSQEHWDALQDLFVSYMDQYHPNLREEMKQSSTRLTLWTHVAAGTFESAVFPAFIQHLPQLQQQNPKKYSWAALRSHLRFHSPYWALDVTTIRIGDTIVSAKDDSNNLNYNENLDTVRHEQDWRAWKQKRYTMKLQRRPFGLYDWDAASGRLKRIVPASAVSAKKNENMRYRVALDTGASLIALAKPLLDLFEREFQKSGNVCKNGPPVGFRVVRDEGTGEEKWYFLTPKDYCYCAGGKGRHFKHCFEVDEKPDDRVALLSLPFYKAFYVGHDYRRKEVLLPS